ncbi:glutathione hydrolase 3-like [Raphanus sativus]|uniref:Glutathione hydrolase n=1 Tax=Raphanus sativus TaxID=3726 RepID=A0A9W3DFX3_RAPSA|nr:glutathione hydrolase 3-like [Raphanus sativus]
MSRGTMQDPFLDIEKSGTTMISDVNKNSSRRNQIAIALCLSLFLLGGAGFTFVRHFTGEESETKSNDKDFVVTSRNGVVAADHETCSEIGADVLRRLDGSAVDAAVAVAFCLGVVNPTSSGIGGGAFMVVGSATGSAKAYDMRETASSTAHQDMFKDREEKKQKGPLSVAVPGEVAGLHEAWTKNGRVDWKLLVKPSIKLARDGFKVGPHLAFALSTNEDKIKNDIGLASVFVIGGKLLTEGDTCKNSKLAETLKKVADKGARAVLRKLIALEPGLKGATAFYQDDVAENLVNDLNNAGGSMTLDDLRNYKVNVTDAMVVNDVMGFKLQGMWPPSSGTSGFAMVMNILEQYKDTHDIDKDLFLHRVIEAIKFMLVARMDLGDPAFVEGISDVVKNMTSKDWARRIQSYISDDQTYPPDYYRNKYKQLKDEGTSHFCVVDRDRNVVSMTTTVNYAFGAGFMSTSTGIILNNQMADFWIPTEKSAAPANYIKANKRPLSSMMPLIITKDNELAGVIGASGGIYIIPAVIQVFLNHFVLKMSPLESVKSPRVYHKLEPNQVLYEDWEVYNKEHILLKKETQDFLKAKKHELVPTNVGATVQFVVQNRVDDSTTVLTAVSDLRKDGKPAAAYAAPTPAPSPML